ncbi:MAG TPA: UDP-3-O-acyl-N-acetylglucosamine deacetylase [Acetobacteraceae bacterium]|jgi:UDP-3-O-[3-hydroxymyristoyl] N-acetylglucosamine deacetylase|nr:UDP-3-O-acyl-N-acetylglucosamine deacetylase [Acetobacteraceae bacterium]
MDGTPQIMVAISPAWQQTLKAPIGCVGVGLHTGRRVSLNLRPADPGHGIVFRRTDLGRDIQARFDRVVDTRLATVLGDQRWASARVGTVEHLLAALAALGIDNVLVELDGPEVPALDGSAAPFVFLLDCAGVMEQSVPRAQIEIRRPVRVSDGDAFAELRPSVSGRPGLEMALSIDFAAAAIGRQALSLRLTPETFRSELARARTFTMAEEVTQLRAAGLAQGGSLDNAVVVDQARILNPGGLRMRDEFARHKLLDAVGDLALAGAPLCGRFIAHRSGHALNNRLLRALFADVSAWRTVDAEPVSVAA